LTDDAAANLRVGAQLALDNRDYAISVHNYQVRVPVAEMHLPGNNASVGIDPGYQARCPGK
jgi:hypothetical protein